MHITLPSQGSDLIIKNRPGSSISFFKDYLLILLKLFIQYEMKCMLRDGDLHSYQVTKWLELSPSSLLLLKLLLDILIALIRGLENNSISQMSIV